MRTHDVVVIGGGLSGLAAARRLEELGADYIVLEARDRVGGRLCTDASAGVPTDVGGAYVGATQDRLLRLAEELDVELFKVHTEGKNVVLLQDARHEYTGVIPALPPLSLLALNQLFTGLDERAQGVDAERPWVGPEAEEDDKRTVASYMESVAPNDPRARAVAGFAVQALLNAEPHEVSLQFFKFYIKSGQGLQRLVEAGAGGAQEFKFVGGSAQVPERIAAALPAGRVQLGRAVCCVRQVAGGGVVVECQDGSSVAARAAVVALAPALYESLGFSPPLPGPRRQLGHRMPMGSIIKTVVFFERAFWRERGFSGAITSDVGPVMASYDDCKPDGSHPALMGFVLARHAHAWAGATPEERRDAICRQYAVAFQAPEMQHCVGYVERNWNDEQFSGGCYVGFMAPGTMTAFGHTIRQPVGALHFAGTETATKWMGYMDGAVQAGERAAVEVARYLHVAHPEHATHIEFPSPFVDDEPESLLVPTRPMPSQEAERRLARVYPHLRALVVGVLAVVVGAWGSSWLA